MSEAIAPTEPLTPAKVFAAEDKLLSLPQVKMPVKHYFGGGVYIRELHIPAGTFVVGHHHRFADFNSLVKGSMTLLMEDGSTKEVSAPLTFLGSPGRKVAFAHEDSVWQNIFSTCETDVGKLEEALFIKSDAFKEKREIIKRLERAKTGLIRDDYAEAIKELGFTEEQAKSISENRSDQMEMPAGTWSFVITESPIHGQGVFATADFKPGDIIGPARIGTMRTPLGRYTNHSPSPNAKLEEFEEGLNLVATKEISGYSGGIEGDEITIDYREAAAVTINLNRRLS